jgi:hypothetical protein
MLTLPTAFAALKDQEASGACFILVLTHYVLGSIGLSTKSLTLPVGGTPVEGIVRDFGTVGQAVNLDDHSYNVSNVTVTLASGWNRRNTAGEWTRIVDVIQGCWGRQAKILIYPGGYANAVSDCLVVFDGTVTRFAQSGDGGLTIEMDEWFQISHRTLPQRLATRAIFPDLPEDQINKRMPLAYGQPSEGFLYFKQTGFFPGMLISEKDYKHIIADHQTFDSAGAANVWLSLPGVNSWGRMSTGAAINHNEIIGGRSRTMITLNPVALSFYAFLFPTSGRPRPTVEPPNMAVDPANPTYPVVAYDNDGATKVSVIAQSTTLATIEFEWSQAGDGSNDPIKNTIAWLDDSALQAFGVSYQRTLGAATGGTLDYWDGTAWVQFATQSGSVMAFGDFGSVWNYANTLTGVVWHLNSGPTGGDGLPFKIRFKYVGTGWTPGVTVAAYIHEVQLRLACRWPMASMSEYGRVTIGSGYEAAPRPSSFAGRMVNVVPYESVGGGGLVAMDGSCGGRMYGTWIDEGARATSNPFNAGQPITTAAGIIESLLRDELGLTTAQIDWASFDTIYNTYPSTAYLSLMDANAADSEEIIRTLCWEHGYFLLRTAAGTIKLINYLGTGVGGTIYPYHLDELPDVQEVPVVPLFKRATINHTRLPHDNKYKRTFDVVDGNPSLLKDDLKATIDLQTIRSLVSTPTLRLTTRLFGTERLMSQPHFLVGLKTTGFRWIALEICDVVTLDYLSFDPQLKLMGQSWQGKSLMIFKKDVTETGVEFTCIYWTPAPL